MRLQHCALAHYGMQEERSARLRYNGRFLNLHLQHEPREGQLPVTAFATRPALSTMMFVSVQMLAMDLPAPINNAAEAKQTNASNRVYSTKSWPSSSRMNR